MEVGRAQEDLVEAASKVAARTKMPEEDLAAAAAAAAAGLVAVEEVSAVVVNKVEVSFRFRRNAQSEFHMFRHV